MIKEWNEVLPIALAELSPLHRQMVEYIANIPGKRLTGYGYALKTWNLNRNQFHDELQSAFSALRSSLKRCGIQKFNDLDFV